MITSYQNFLTVFRNNMFIINVMEAMGGEALTQPRIEDHIVLHSREGLFNPMIPGVWSNEYADQVAQYVSTAGQTANPDTKRAISQLVLSPDWAQSLDMTVLSDLHIAEAEARGITPWTLQEVLFMQENLYRSGMLEPANLVLQRGEILQRLGDVGEESRDYAGIGQRVCGLELCVTSVWPLTQVSEERARELQNLVTEKVGSKFYEAKVRFNMGQRRGDEAMIRAAEQELSSSHAEAANLNSKFLMSLPDEEKVKVARVLIKANNQALKQNLQTQMQEWKERAAKTWDKVKGTFQKRPS